MKKVGIWLDKEKAMIVTFKDDVESLEVVRSDLEFYHPKGGSRSKTRWGPQDVVQDRKYLEREKHQLKKYFQNITEKVTTADSLVIFGPAEAGEKFRKELGATNPDLVTKIKKVLKADSMTDNQVKALVRDFYKKQEF